MFDFQEWYINNSDKLSRSRKRKYRRDPEYREKCKERAKKYYTREKKRPKGSCFIKVTPDGQIYYTIGKICKMIGKKQQTVRQYHTTGVLPEPSARDSRGWRLYTVSQAKVIVATFNKFKRKKIKTLKQVSETIKKNWVED